MAPNSKDSVQEKSKEWFDGKAEQYSPRENIKKKEVEIVWSNVALISLLHLFGIYGLYLTFVSAKLYTVVYLFITYQMTIFGITAGAHRLWSHRSYKATMPLKFLLVYFNTMAHQFSVISWAREHRMHHKYDGTNADPHNINRGFFFAHVGWVMSKKHEDIKTKGKSLDLSDLYNDSLLRFQHKNYVILTLIACYVIPTIVPMILWNEAFKVSFFVNILRFVLAWVVSCSVNSFNHLWGNKPYNQSINATQSAILGLLVGGEGWHNYHHTFPSDYRAAEFGTFNFTMQFIEFFEKIGWAYDLKSPSEETIRRTVQRSGDGTHLTWRYGDKDQSPEDY